MEKPDLDTSVSTLIVVPKNIRLMYCGSARECGFGRCVDNACICDGAFRFWGAQGAEICQRKFGSRPPDVFSNKRLQLRCPSRSPRMFEFRDLQGQYGSSVGLHRRFSSCFSEQASTAIAKELVTTELVVKVRRFSAD